MWEHKRLTTTSLSFHAYGLWFSTISAEIIDISSIYHYLVHLLLGWCAVSQCCEIFAQTCGMWQALFSPSGWESISNLTHPTPMAILTTVPHYESSRVEKHRSICALNTFTTTEQNFKLTHWPWEQRKKERRTKFNLSRHEIKNDPVCFLTEK